MTREDIFDAIMHYVFQDKPNPYVLSGMLDALIYQAISTSEEEPAE